ncbi:hypothetical protein J6590_003094 [Homalodisca vitripennis]|nr:hypothetical protein J6590_003094 [Homalodisca vitripennis]
MAGQAACLQVQNRSAVSSSQTRRCLIRLSHHNRLLGLYDKYASSGLSNTMLGNVCKNCKRDLNYFTANTEVDDVFSFGQIRLRKLEGTMTFETKQHAIRVKTAIQRNKAKNRKPSSPSKTFSWRALGTEIYKAYMNFLLEITKSKVIITNVLVLFKVAIVRGRKMHNDLLYFALLAVYNLPSSIPLSN